MKNSIRKKECVLELQNFMSSTHLFAAITMTINPRYVYTDMAGNQQNISIFDKSKIPPQFRQNVQYKSMVYVLVELKYLNQYKIPKMVYQ